MNAKFYKMKLSTYSKMKGHKGIIITIRIMVWTIIMKTRE